MSSADTENQAQRTEHVFLSGMPGQKVIALTGTIGSGKSTAARYVNRQFPVIDCDKVNAELLEKGHEGYDALCASGLVSLDKSGNIDKAKMAETIFTDPDKKKRVEALLHPMIFRKVDEWIRKQNARAVFVEMPILFEIGADRYFRTIWCVVCDPDTAVDRLMKYRAFSKEDALRRIASQWSAEKKEKQSTLVIDNSGTEAQLEQKIKQLMERL